MLRPSASFTALAMTVLCFAAAGAFEGAGAQASSTPRQGGAERRAILDALRVPVQKDLKQKVVFVVDRLKVQGDWAFLRGAPRGLNDRPIDYRKTPFAETIRAGAFDDGIVALLHRKGRKWRVVQYAIGATDVPWVDWGKRFKAPSAIFK